MVKIAMCDVHSADILTVGLKKAKGGSCGGKVGLLYELVEEKGGQR
jgi:hypothetical protein